MITLDDKFKVTTDSSLQNFQLEKLEDVKNKQSGDIVRQEYKIIGFHGNSIKSVLHQYAKEAVIDDVQLETLHNVLDKLKEIDQTIDRVAKKLNIKLETKQDD